MDQILEYREKIRSYLELRVNELIDESSSKESSGSSKESSGSSKESSGSSKESSGSSKESSGSSKESSGSSKESSGSSKESSGSSKESSGSSKESSGSSKESSGSSKSILAKKLEKHIYNASIRLGKRKGINVKRNFMTIYPEIVYNIISNSNPVAEINNLKNDKVDWNHPIYDDFNSRRSIEENIHTSEAADVIEGLYTCGKCGSKRVCTMQFQLRSGDEGMTNFFICAKCNSVWKQNN